MIPAQQARNAAALNGQHLRIFEVGKVEGGALIANPPWDDDTRTGPYGAGSQATAEKGRLWLEAAIEEKAEHVEEIHEQQERREARRNAGFGEWGKGMK